MARGVMTGRWHREAILAILLPLAACQMPEPLLEQRAATMEPAAVGAAEERAKSDLACGEMRGKVLSRDYPKQQTPYSLYRVVYRVETTGCRKKTVYSVACVSNGPCSAMSDTGGLVEKQ
jgi:hypothetical protein